MPRGTHPLVHLFTLDESFSSEQQDRLVELLKIAGLAACVDFPPPSTGPRPFQSGPRPDLNVDEMARMCPKSENVAARELWIAHKTLLAELPTIQLVGELVGDLVSRVRR